MLLEKLRIQNSLKSYMKTVLYEFEEYAAQNPIMLKDMRRIKLAFNNGERCYTNGKTIVIGSDFPVLKSRQNHGLIYKKAQGILIHEMAHILYTDFNIFSSFFNTAPQKYKKFASASKSVFNILEDYRIEETISNHNKYFKKLFLMVRFEIIKEIKDILREKAMGGFKNDSERADFLLNSLLIMGFTKKPFFSGDKQTDQMIQTCYFYVRKSINASSTEDIAACSDNIMKLLQKFKIEEPLTELPLAQTLLGKKTPQGSRETLSGGLSNTSFGEANETDVVQDIGKNLENANLEEDNTEETLGKLEMEMSKELENVERNNLTENIVNGYFNSEKHEKKQDILLENEAKKIKEFAKSLPSNHNNHRLVMKENMVEFPIEDYDEIRSQLQIEINRAVKEVENLKQAKIEDYEYNLKSGSLDSSSLARFVALNETDIFKQRFPEEEVLNMDVMLLVDCSGSNASKVYNTKNDTSLPRYVVNQMMAVYFHEVLKKLEFKHSVWGFDTGKTENISPMVSFQDCFSKKSGLKLADISARGSNRDGYHIRLAGKTLDSNAETKKKLLIVVSDGQPAASNYSGESAMKDVKEAQEELKKIDVKTIGIFTGHAQENKYFEDMYDNHYFLNNDSINDFAKTFHDLLAKEFKSEL